MLDCSLIVEELVALLRAIPTLVTQMAGNEEQIKAFHHRYPRETSWLRALHGQASPSILISHQSSAFAGEGRWNHVIAMGIRAAENLPDDPPASYSTIVKTIVDSVPTGKQVGILNDPVILGAEIIGTDYNFLTDEEGVDYPQLVFTIEEK